MSFLKETDYHGSRSYDGEQPAEGFIHHFRLRASLTFAWIRLQIEKFIALTAAPLRTSLVHHGEKHFTVLGSRQRAVPARRPITDIFPVPDSNNALRRK